ncbi:deoxyribonuclease-1-like [Dreissena polymorpha]|uniref:Endonuclease/exonuclease/phosphatase domain-containing protein n=1 Tax=Dreissena polymorpha TaxID=45954 RepID=A0A9D3Y3K8_DREPO|nr:deoxyribonuclease-1-like [Dreissena polymorpha]KAH3692406.1 hypothetical protein DPMN_194856 [Dreissena polymorpha]
MCYHTVLFAFGLCLVSMTTGFILNGEPIRNTNSSLPSMAAPPLRVGSFNIQVFGQTKYSKPEIMAVIVKILSRYDIVQVLEIRDATGAAFEHLLADLNNYVKVHIGLSAVYGKVISPRLGRTSSKEQYGFLYRTSKVNVSDTYLYSDTHDVFEREPYGVQFHSPTTVVQDFVLMANHIQPSAAVLEMDQLPAVYDEFTRHFRVQDVIIAGDFNADCQYMKPSDWLNISLRTDQRFTWLVQDDLDTTVGVTACSYDKFVLGGDLIAHAVVPDSVQAYRFDEDLAINRSFAVEISDHYPIEMQIKGSPNIQTQKHLVSSVSFTVTNSFSVSKDTDIQNVYHVPSCTTSPFVVKLLMDGTRMDHMDIVANLRDVDSIIPQLQNFSANCPRILTPETLSMVDGYVRSGMLTASLPDVYGLVYSPNVHVFETAIRCSLQLPYICSVTVSKQISGN